MPEDPRFDWRRTLGIGVPVLALAAGAYLRFGILQPLREDEGYERYVRRWTPVATEFRVRQVRLARAIIRSARIANRCRLLTPAMLQAVEARALRLVRCESRPVYPSGRRGRWGDTGARWQLSQAA